MVACAPLIPSENITLTQYRVAEITMSQGSPFEDTVITSTGTREEVGCHLVLDLVYICSKKGFVVTLNDFRLLHFLKRLTRQIIL